MKHLLLTTIAAVLVVGCGESIHHAAWDDDIGAIQVKLNAGENINAKDESGRTPLHHAIEHGNLNVVKFLIDNGADVNFEEPSLNPLLLLATYYKERDGEKEIEELLIAKGVNINSEGVFHKAASRGHNEIVEVLITKGADVNVRSSKYTSETHLHVAAKRGRLEIAKKLIANGADMNAVTIGGYLFDKFTPLHCAAFGGYPKVLELLIINGANLNTKDAHGKTPLDICESIHNYSINTDIRKTDRTYAESFHLARLDCCYILRENGAKRAEELKAEGAM
jgi:ankyrin repeat protein